ncbi:MAG TPA: DUF192 domain-containing protein [Rhodanobacteraceae bacterium]|nr:DUF192 domain-containing protein [Rhodanobacteraceae bacterium]
MKRFLLPLMLVLGCSACAAAPLAASQEDAPHAVVLDSHHFSVELATTSAMRARGLMDRTQLAADHGMLFVFAHQAPQTFWMKDTLIPLDILYFDKDRKLVSMQLNVPPCKADPCPIYPSNKPAKYVLELQAGMAVKIGASVGDELTIKGRIGNVEP